MTDRTMKIFDLLATDPDYARRFAAELRKFTRFEMCRLRHIPMRYFVAYGTAETEGDRTKTLEALQAMAGELNEKGHIDLDADGRPCCLTGGPAVVENSKTGFGETHGEATQGTLEGREGQAGQDGGHDQAGDRQEAGGGP